MGVSKKSWDEFRETGLLLFVNQLLHLFGWAIVFETENNIVKNCYPARVKYRGFKEEAIDMSYVKTTKYLKDNINELYAEIQPNEVG